MSDSPIGSLLAFTAKLQARVRQLEAEVGGEAGSEYDGPDDSGSFCILCGHNLIEECGFGADWGEGPICFCCAEGCEDDDQAA
jgi:hypothetical protein